VEVLPYAITKYAQDTVHKMNRSF